MNTTKLVLAASFFSAAIMLGAGESSSANAAPLAEQSQLAQFVKADTAVKKAGWKKRRVRRFLRHHYRYARWCHNHPRRCYGYRAYRYGPRYGYWHYRAYRGWAYAR
jgi:hypothetical protein